MSVDIRLRVRMAANSISWRIRLERNQIKVNNSDPRKDFIVRTKVSLLEYLRELEKFLKKHEDLNATVFHVEDKSAQLIQSGLFPYSASLNEVLQKIDFQAEFLKTVLLEAERDINNLLADLTVQMSVPAVVHGNPTLNHLLRNPHAPPRVTEEVLPSPILRAALDIGRSPPEPINTRANKKQKEQIRYKLEYKPHDIKKYGWI